MATRGICVRSAIEYSMIRLEQYSTTPDLLLEHTIKTILSLLLQKILEKILVKNYTPTTLFLFKSCSIFIIQEKSITVSYKQIHFFTFILRDCIYLIVDGETKN
ncbi:MAG: hypothetical protein LZ173_09585 [Thaumarchaeota archaeon]|nr:hypothetical protein [Candidatus Geocrenenecus arthurdayi]